MCVFGNSSFLVERVRTKGERGIIIKGNVISAKNVNFFRLFFCTNPRKKRPFPTISLSLYCSGENCSRTSKWETFQTFIWSIFAPYSEIGRHPDLYRLFIFFVPLVSLARRKLKILPNAIRPISPEARFLVNLGHMLGGWRESKRMSWFL